MRNPYRIFGTNPAVLPLDNVFFRHSVYTGYAGSGVVGSGANSGLWGK